MEYPPNILIRAQPFTCSAISLFLEPRMEGEEGFERP